MANNQATDMATGEAVEVIETWRKELVLASRPHGMPDESNFKVFEFKFTYTRPLQDENAVALQVLYISIDPYLREIMNEDNHLSGIRPFEIGKPVEALSLSKVLSSSVPEFKEGDYVLALTPVTNYVLVRLRPNVFIKKIERKGDIPLAHYLGVLGMPGHTAWVGVNIIGKLQSGEEMYVSAAAGAVGLVAGQLGKIKGCRVVGSAGSDEKVKKLKEVYNYDEAFNYRDERDWVAALRRYLPQGFDVYYENVGGRMLEAALETIRTKGRIVVCGMVSQYNKKTNERDGVRNLMNVVGKSLRMEGFVELSEYQETWDAFLEEVGRYLLEGKIQYETDVLGRGVEEFPKALAALLQGENKGKAVLHVSDDK